MNDDMIFPLVCLTKCFKNCAEFFIIILGVGPFNCHNYRTGDQVGHDLRPSTCCVVPFNEVYEDKFKINRGSKKVVSRLKNRFSEESLKCHKKQPTFLCYVSESEIYPFLKKKRIILSL